MLTPSKSQEISFLFNRKKNWRVASEIKEKRIQSILKIDSRFFRNIGLKVKNARFCPSCGSDSSQFEVQEYIFCSSKCKKSAEQKTMEYLSSELKLKFKSSNKFLTASKSFRDSQSNEILVSEILNIILDWFSSESCDNSADAEILNLVDDYRRGKVSLKVGGSSASFTVIDEDLTKVILKTQPQKNLESKFPFPLATSEVFELLTEFYGIQDVDNFLTLMSMKKFLYSNKFIDGFTLCYFGASSDLISAVGDRVFLNTDRLRSWIRSRSFTNVESLLEFTDQLSFASSSLKVWPNMSILIYPWICFPSSLAISNDVQRSYLAKLITEMVRNVKRQDLKAWCREISYFNFEIDTGKEIKARRQYSETFNVSRERARQVSLPSKPLSDYVLSLQKDIYEFGVMKARDQLSVYIRSHPGITFKELDNLFSIDNVSRQWLRQKYRHLMLDESHRDDEPRSRLNRVDVLKSLRAASTLHWPLTAKKYQQALDAGFIDGVSSYRVLQIFNTWKNACDEANVECGEPLRHDYTRDFSINECLHFVGEYLKDENYNGTHAGYSIWRKNHQVPDRVPSVGTLRNRMGDRSWAGIVRSALENLREHWSAEILKE